MTIWASSVQSEVPCLSQQKNQSNPRLQDVLSFHVFITSLSSSCTIFLSPLQVPLLGGGGGVSLCSHFRDPSVPIPSCHLFLKLDTHWSICHPHNSFLDTTEAPQIQPAPSPVLSGTGNDAMMPASAQHLGDNCDHSPTVSCGACQCLPLGVCLGGLIRNPLPCLKLLTHHPPCNV